MVKHGNAKKRRSGTRKAKLKSAVAHQKFKPPKFTSEAIRASWNPALPPLTNMANLGLQSAVNDDIKNPAGRNQKNTVVHGDNIKKAIELFDIPTNDRGDMLPIPKHTKKDVLLPMSVDEQEYVVKCMEKHGVDTVKMARDIKTNVMQHTQAKLEKMVGKFKSLKESERVAKFSSKVGKLL